MTVSESATVDPNEVYALGSSEGESARLQQQSDELTPESSDLLDRAGLRPGDSAIDLGCGPRGVLDLLSERVGPTGKVVGLDADPRHIEMAADFVTARALSGIEVQVGDARRTGLDAGSFDLVHARTLLVTVPDPVAVLTEMVRLARPGGRVVGMEPDMAAGLCYPAHPAVDRITKLLPAVFSRNGADLLIGRRMAELYRQAGLIDVVVEARSTVYPPGHSRRTITADLVRAMRPQILELGLADAAGLDALNAAARAHLEHPETVVMPNLFFLVWGRKP